MLNHKLKYNLTKAVQKINFTRNLQSFTKYLRQILVFM